MVRGRRALYRFIGSSQGGIDAPSGDLILGADHSLLGTVQAGGASNRWLVFRLTRSPSGWQEGMLHYFAGEQDGAAATGLPGRIFGTTNDGGGTPRRRNRVSTGSRREAIRAAVERHYSEK